MSSPELQTAKRVVVNYWQKEAERHGTTLAFSEVYRVMRASPEELIEDYKALYNILGRAIEQEENKK